ncbi:uncharacterized protein N7469_005884 [Penicillium citrinum]|uniref:Uncharacterized protein n=1 Tax=Penicillium citrinum TaxID=5077 RepID=A0A9W9NX91_PENCI|nr:uncharacterized protein N7469_005884 [Penicillium citrinum]KAJ5231296.1 hypothetical protein N7469_005884 [Penicillium citrinum]
MDLRGAAPRPSTVQEMANLLLAKHGSIVTVSWWWWCLTNMLVLSTQTVGEKWIYNFTQRYIELKPRFSRKYDYQYTKQEDPKFIQKWFDTVQQTITE